MIDTNRFGCDRPYTDEFRRGLEQPRWRNGLADGWKSPLIFPQENGQRSLDILVH